MNDDYSFAGGWAGSGYEVKQDGPVATRPSGMMKEDAGKPQPTLIPTGFLWRLSRHMSAGAKKYGRNNWKLGNSAKELDDFRDAAFRHFLAWLDDEEDEDHLAAVSFNMWAADHVRKNLVIE
jgi:hypothetical protein